MLNLAVPKKVFGLSLLLHFFDRCAKASSLHRPQDALGRFATDFATLSRYSAKYYHNAVKLIKGKTKDQSIWTGLCFGSSSWT